jgi:hypothetical protein
LAVVQGGRPGGWRIPIAIVLAGVFVAGGIIASATTLSGGVTTFTSTTTVTAAPTSQTPGLHELTFRQVNSFCGYDVPWAVSLWNSAIGNLTLTGPPGAVVTHNQSEWSTANSDFTTVIFTVPSGNYSYKVSTVNGDVFGQATVLLSDTTVAVLPPPAGKCGP